MKKWILYGIYNLLGLMLFPFFMLFLVGACLRKPVYRKNIAQRFGRYPSDFFLKLRNKKVIWVHASSVGEVMMSRLFVQNLRKQYPNAGIVISTMTPTGQAAAREYLAACSDLFIYFPFDLNWIVPAVVQKISPTLFIFMETEIWPNCLKTLAAKKIPTVMVNGRISNNSFPRYQKLKPFLVHALSDVAFFLMQSAEDVQRIIALGAPPAQVQECGNMKYDQAASSAASTNKMPTKATLALSEDRPLMIAGSTRPGEEEPILEAYQNLRLSLPTLALLIAPRHLNRLEMLEKQLRDHGLVSIRKSQLSAPNRDAPLEHRPVILLDTLGELNRLYALGDYIFVGGSLADFGGHNPLEPAAHKKPVFFGPHMENFRDIALALIASGGGISVTDGKQLGQAMVALAQNPEDYKKCAEAAYGIVLKHQGAVRRHLDRITNLMATR
ncbi:MAG: 3-deoxy-D-manno-octulosonic acid transferase [Nitrospirae bacterium]|nr:3-deoxy-D-manno-octulosonic acid transferase [Candidatus Manganitrophaceae bacterium]